MCSPPVSSAGAAILASSISISENTFCIFVDLLIHLNGPFPRWASLARISAEDSSSRCYTTLPRRGHVLIIIKQLMMMMITYSSVGRGRAASFSSFFSYILIIILTIILTTILTTRRTGGGVNGVIAWEGRSCGDTPPWRVRPGRRAVGRNSRSPQVGPGTPC